MPLFIENEDFLVVNACWDDKHIDWIKQNYKGKLTDGFLAKTVNDKMSEYHVIEETLKGKEEKLSKDHSFLDKDGVERSECRIIWWQPIENRINYIDILMFCPTKLENEPIDIEEVYSYKSNKPVFFGYYWLKGVPKIINKKAICLDYSVAKKGQLVTFKSEYLTNLEQIENGFVY